jgi:hypothetical protein
MRAMGVVFVDVAGEARDEVRDKLIQDLLAQGCLAREGCGDGIGLRVDLPKGLTRQDFAGAAAGTEAARAKVAKIAGEETGDGYDHPDGFFWHLDGFLVYSRDKSGSAFTITTLDDEGRVIGTARGDASTLAKRKWDRRTVLKQALKPLWRRFAP